MCHGDLLVTFDGIGHDDLHPTLDFGVEPSLTLVPVLGRALVQENAGLRCRARQQFTGTPVNHDTVLADQVQYSEFFRTVPTGNDLGIECPVLAGGAAELDHDAKVFEPPLPEWHSRQSRNNFATNTSSAPINAW